MIDPATRKADLRRHLRAFRRALPAAQAQEAAQALAGAALDLPPGAEVAGYVAQGSEIDPLPLLRRLAAAGHPLALPIPEARGTPMRFARWWPGAPLIEGPLCQIPAAGEPVTPDVLLVPLLGFDRCGNRLGQGGGFYDATLAELRRSGGVLAIGLAFAGQEVDNIPTDRFDAPLDAILTERELILR